MQRLCTSATCVLDYILRLIEGTKLVGHTTGRKKSNVLCMHEEASEDSDIINGDCKDASPHFGVARTDIAQLRFCSCQKGKDVSR